ncbi:MAG: polysaccharide biosynthesis/export family protein [Terrimicrobiaceae bacterium]
MTRIPYLATDCPYAALLIRRRLAGTWRKTARAGVLLLIVAAACGARDACAEESGQPLTGGSTYLIRRDDTVNVKVFQEDDLLTDARVSAAGSIRMPLIGDVVIAGKSPDAAARSIQDALAKTFLVDPQVSLTVTGYAKRSFTVLGEVQKPGVYDIPDLQEISLLTAIGYGNGFTKMADPSNIRVKRIVDGKWVIYKLNGKRMATDSSAFVIRPDDVIVVGERLL